MIRLRETQGHGRYFSYYTADSYDAVADTH